MCSVVRDPAEILNRLLAQTASIRDHDGHVVRTRQIRSTSSHGANKNARDLHLCSASCRRRNSRYGGFIPRGSTNSIREALGPAGISAANTPRTIYVTDLD